MGAICEAGTGLVCALEAHHLIGRSHRCSLRLDESSVSGEHASLRWTGQTWIIKDLGSRYGTFLNTQPLQPGIPVTLQKEARLAFGREKHTWIVTDEGPPEVMVMPADGGPALVRHGGMIAIPSSDAPAAVIYQGQDGGWILDQDGRIETIEEQVPFVVDGGRWRLCNASPLQSTSMPELGREVTPLEGVQLHFRVSRNEEHVEMSVRWRDRQVDLGARSHSYVLLTLARARLRDLEAGRLPENAGWTDQEELLARLRFAPERLNLDIFRARRQFGAAGFIPAAGIVERRAATKELRIGASNISILVE